MCQGWFFDQVDRDCSTRRNTAIGLQQFKHHDLELGLEALPGSASVTCPGTSLDVVTETLAT